MICLDVVQGSPEWHDARRSVVTASEVAMFMLERPKCRLTKAELQEVLAEKGIEFKKSATNDELIALLPDVTPYLSLTETTKQARAKYLAKLLTESLPRDEFEQEAEDRLQRQLDNDPWIKRGKSFEGAAREALSKRINREIKEVGLILHDSREFGGSPDGLVVSDDGDTWEAGCEIKLHNAPRHLADLLSGELPSDHQLQIHTSLCVTGLKRWHYFAYHPSLPPLHVVVEWDEFTDQVLAGLLSLAEEKKALKETLAAMWEAEFESPKLLEGRAES